MYLIVSPSPSERAPEAGSLWRIDVKRLRAVNGSWVAIVEPPTRLVGVTPYRLAIVCSPEREKSRATSLPPAAAGEANGLFRFDSEFSSLTLTEVLSSSIYRSPGDFEGLRLGYSRSLSLQLSGVISMGLTTPFCCEPATKIGRLRPRLTLTRTTCT